MTIQQLQRMKQVDLIGQIAAPLLTVWHIHGLNPDGAQALPLFCALFVLGGWQLVSFIATRFVTQDADYWKSPLRPWYLGALVFFGMLSLAATQGGEALTALLLGLLFGSPVLALLYWGLSAAELVRLGRLLEASAYDHEDGASADDGTSTQIH